MCNRNCYNSTTNDRQHSETDRILCGKNPHTHATHEQDKLHNEIQYCTFRSARACVCVCRHVIFERNGRCESRFHFPLWTTHKWIYEFHRHTNNRHNTFGVGGQTFRANYASYSSQINDDSVRDLRIFTFVLHFYAYAMMFELRSPASLWLN